MKLHIRPAFTLIELLVVSAVFSLLFLVAATVFSSIQLRQREILARQRLVGDARHVLEAIARTVRLQRIDYNYYYTAPAPEGDPDLGPDFPTNILVTRNSLNEQTCYRIISEKIQVGKDCNNWTDLTPGDLKIKSFYIWMNPLSNPYLASPTQLSDCRRNILAAPPNSATFDSAAGACDCSDGVGPFTADATECFPGQRCVATGSSPAYICQNATQQPVVTIKITSESSTGPGSAIQTTLQTTITSRVYGS